MKTLSRNIDQLFFIVIGMLFFFTQRGFAFPEKGAKILKNKRNILKKSIIEYATATIFYLAIQYVTAIGIDVERFIGYLNLFKNTDGERGSLIFLSMSNRSNGSYNSFRCDSGEHQHTLQFHLLTGCTGSGVSFD